MLRISCNERWANSCSIILCVHISSMLKLGRIFFLKLFLSTLRVRALGNGVRSARTEHNPKCRAGPPPQDSTTNDVCERERPPTTQCPTSGPQHYPPTPSGWVGRSGEVGEPPANDQGSSKLSRHTSSKVTWHHFQVKNRMYTKLQHVTAHSSASEHSMPMAATDLASDFSVFGFCCVSLFWFLCVCDEPFISLLKGKGCIRPAFSAGPRVRNPESQCTFRASGAGFHFQNLQAFREKRGQSKLPADLTRTAWELRGGGDMGEEWEKGFGDS